MYHVVIVAGGSGSRMQSELPKQFIELQSKPILMHTIERFAEFPEKLNIILVLPQKDIPLWEELCEKHSFQADITTVMGGQTRYHSVKNGLKTINDDQGYVAIHDGVRPFIELETIALGFETAKEKGSAVVSVPLKDSIREVDGEANKAVERSAYRLIQTPQTFPVRKLKEAFASGYQEAFTDDASVYEFAGHSITLIEGDYKNIKLTTPEDLVVAEAFLNSSK